MTAMEPNGLSGRDLRLKLFDLMKSKGIVDNVKVIHDPPAFFESKMDSLATSLDSSSRPFDS